jgi:type IV pilus biogenesis protein CpaD/CtpE
MHMEYRNTMVALAVSIGSALVGACAHEPSELERNFGSSVRNMIEAQTYDPSTLSSPSTETLEGGDGRRVEAVLEVYRTDVAQPDAASEEIVISVDGGR